MAKHKYQITVEAVADEAKTRAAQPTLCFQTENHDDIIALAAKLGLQDEKGLAFILGLKLVGETLLEDRENPLYKEFAPHFGAFMKSLKRNARSEPSDS